MIPVSDHTIAMNCAPTLAGIKTGSMFSVSYTNRKSFMRELSELNTVLTRHGLCAVLLRYMNKRALVYIFRPDDLRQDLLDPAAIAILRERGYTESDPRICLQQLIRQFRQSKDFPHEVGLFLGYPPEDVRGFIANPHSGYHCVGCWKVYGDRTKAEQLFDRYRRCTKAYCRETARGTALEKLIVSTRRTAFEPT